MGQLYIKQPSLEEIKPTYFLATTATISNYKQH